MQLDTKTAIAHQNVRSLLGQRQRSVEEQTGDAQLRVSQLQQLLRDLQSQQVASSQQMQLQQTALMQSQVYSALKLQQVHPAKNKKTATSGAKSNQPVLSGKKQPKSEVPPTPIMPKAPTIVDEDDSDARWNFNTEAAFKDWYPTLRKAIWLLSKIYRLVHVRVVIPTKKYFTDMVHSRPSLMTWPTESCTAPLSHSPKLVHFLPNQPRLQMPLCFSFPICFF